MLRVQVCRGMMCSSYGGGRRLEQAFEAALRAAGVADQVELIAPGCMGSCSEGPCVRIAGQKFYHVNPEDLPELIAKEILPRLSE
ncbi:MAG: (2Fe-2S) ferredoxin domain-containing protein [Clostridia bacterium]|nr:(2Fe-2S) ferredoxin domain-containing protein [Clostridia bacterium]